MSPIASWAYSGRVPGVAEQLFADAEGLLGCGGLLLRGNQRLDGRNQLVAPALILQRGREFLQFLDARLRWRLLCRKGFGSDTKAQKTSGYEHERAEERPE